MKNVTLVYDCLLSEKNGANTVINQIVNSEYLDNKGVHVVAISPDAWTRGTGISSTIVKKSNLKSKIKGGWLFLAQYSSLAAALYLLFVSRIAKRVAKKYVLSNPAENEIAFFHTLYPCYYYLKYRKKHQSTVLVMHTSGDTFKMFRTYYKALDRSLYYKWLLKMEQYVLQNVDRISFVSETSMKNFLKSHPYVDSSKVYFIYNGVPDEIKAETGEKDNDIVEFCCVASISRRKGQCYIIEALKMFEKENLPKVHFTFVGDGNDRDVLQQDVKKAGLDKYVSFVGVTQNVDEYLVKSDAYILASEDEGLPMAIIEAMRASLPIISTPVGGIPEMVIDGYNGVMIEPVANSIYDFLLKIDRYDWKSLGGNARKTFEERFTTEKMLEGYSKLLTF